MRVRPHEAALCRSAAIRELLTFSEFARDALLRRAREVLAQQAHDQGLSSAPVVPVEDVLGGFGLGSLDKGVPISSIEEALRKLGEKVVGADPLHRASVREAAIKRLKEVGIGAPALMVDAALGRAREDKAAQ